MASIIYRKLTDPPQKKNWIPPNRKYKWMFWLSFSINLIFIIDFLTTICR